MYLQKILMTVVVRMLEFSKEECTTKGRKNRCKQLSIMQGCIWGNVFKRIEKGKQLSKGRISVAKL